MLRFINDMSQEKRHYKDSWFDFSSSWTHVFFKNEEINDFPGIMSWISKNILTDVYVSEASMSSPIEDHDWEDWAYDYEVWENQLAEIKKENHFLDYISWAIQIRRNNT